MEFLAAQSILGCSGKLLGHSVIHGPALFTDGHRQHGPDGHKTNREDGQSQHHLDEVERAGFSQAAPRWMGIMMNHDLSTFHCRSSEPE